MKEEDYYKVIKIPHLKYTVYIQDMSKLVGQEIKGGGYTVKLSDGLNPWDDKSCIFFEDVSETVKLPENFPMIAHEVMHVIQIICDEYGMQIEQEQEHTAYLMTYLLEEILK